MGTVCSDAELVLACIEGALAAFEDLVKRYQDVLYRNALCYVQDPEEARDIVQEAFLKAFEELPGLNDPAKFGSWIRSITRNRCLNAIRSRRREMAVQKEIEKEMRFERPDTSPVERKGMVSVRDLLSTLPEESAQAFTMHYIDELPIKSIAQELGSSSQSIKQRLYRARQQLQQEVLKMVKDNIGRQKLPDDFPERVIANLLKTGRKDRLYMRYDQARARFQEALEAVPESPEALLELGRTYDPLRWPDQRNLETLERAAASSPDSVEVMGELEIAYRQSGYEQKHARIFQKSLELCEKRLGADPGDVRALKAKARLEMGTGDYKGAEELLQRAVEQAPEDQEAWYYLALAMSRQKRYEEASGIYEKTRGMDPRTVWSYFSLRQLSTHLAFRKGEAAKAVEYMEEVWKLTQRPNEAGNLIYFYSATEQLQKALEVFEAVKAHRYHPRVYITVGIAHMKEGDFQSAGEMLRTATESTNDSALREEAQLHLARTLFALERANEARNALEDGLKLDISQRTGLARKKSSAFWLPWTGWLNETLSELQKHDPRVPSFLRAVREELAQISS